MTTDRTDEILGRLDEIAEQIKDLASRFPELELYCPPLIEDDGAVTCIGGQRLTRNRADDADPDQYSHILPEEKWGNITVKGATFYRKYHNVWRSYAITADEGITTAEAPPPDNTDAQAPPAVSGSDLSAFYQWVGGRWPQAAKATIWEALWVDGPEAGVKKYGSLRACALQLAKRWAETPSLEPKVNP